MNANSYRSPNNSINFPKRTGKMPFTFKNYPNLKATVAFYMSAIHLALVGIIGERLSPNTNMSAQALFIGLGLCGLSLYWLVTGISILKNKNK